ncbi:epidermal growth factor receptor-like [Oncorhynchus masou masou]|uniref:epidermal growth factor receptor-like n=1 Tax=Oncorhynchus masou masou TaxID=90313 RepID=UPI0031844FB6
MKTSLTNTMSTLFQIWIIFTSLVSYALPEKKVCQGVTNRFSLLGSKEDHYLNMVKTYSNCTVVLENLEVTYMEDDHDLSFLRSIQEVGGYVLIALNTANRIPLDNLRIIRGHTLYDSGFALVVVLNYNKSMRAGTTELPLTSLTEILKGGVKFSDNQLCNVETIQWLDIVNSNSKPNMQLPEHSNNRLCKELLLEHKHCVT